MKLAYKKNDEAVSPVIATILMVAITVVLAAVLYVMVIGMGGGGGATAPAGSVTFDIVSNESAKIQFGTFSPVPAPMDVKVILTPSAGSIVELSFPAQPTATAPDMTVTPSASGIAAEYIDMNYAGNAVNSGDYILVDGLTPSTAYTVTIYHYDSDSLCSLVGQTTFSLPA
jgi:flagellin-like protein